MSTLSSGRGIIWASKSGAGLRERACSRLFLLDRTEVRREVTQKNTVGQDARLKGTQWGNPVNYSLWRTESGPGCMRTCLEGGWETDTKRMRSAKFSHLYKDVCLQAVQSSRYPGLKVPQTALLDVVITLSLWWNLVLHSTFIVASLLAQVTPEKNNGSQSKVQDLGKMCK